VVLNAQLVCVQQEQQLQQQQQQQQQQAACHLARRCSKKCMNAKCKSNMQHRYSTQGNDYFHEGGGIDKPIG